MKTGWMRRISYGCRRFTVQTTAATAIIFALSMPMFVAAAGVSVDLAQAYNIKTRLANAVDKAALAAGSTTGSLSDIELQVQRFIDANYQEDRLGETYNVEVTFGDGNVRVTASARVPTTFMRIFGHDYIDVYQETIVKRELAGVEVALVLDVTGSMAGNNITALRTASTNFLNIMFSRISDPEYLKIGIVPFSASVNVGAVGAGFVNWPTTDPYKNPASIVYNNGTTGTTTDWRGCILERASPLDTRDDETPNWGMYRYPRICSQFNSDGTCRTYSNNNPNTGCTVNRIVPLTNNQNTLQTAINGLAATGNTYINVGLVWGWRVLSPTPPFTQGSEYGDPDWSKTIILMTDGDNVPLNAYSAYGANPGITAAQLNTRMMTVCQSAKDAGVTLYTITFQSGINNATRELFRQCASDPSKYFNAPSNQDLISAFENIANQLSQLHIVK
ncbi:MAG: pilus assembly protein [Alphaproteobacteria bacterium]|nr:pilus assembly protein [Alphaproteobacteria bacterium]